MFEALAEVFIQAAQPRPTHTAVNAVKRSGLCRVNKLAAGLGHGRSLGAQALNENQIGCNLGSDLSEGWVSIVPRFTGKFIARRDQLTLLNQLNWFQPLGSEYWLARNKTSDAPPLLGCHQIPALCLHHCSYGSAREASNVSPLKLAEMLTNLGTNFPPSK